MLATNWSVVLFIYSYVYIVVPSRFLGREEQDRFIQHLSVVVCNVFKCVPVLVQKTKPEWHSKRSRGRCCTKFKAISVKFFQWDQNLYESLQPCSWSKFPCGPNYSKIFAFLMRVNHCVLTGWAPSPPTSFHFSFYNSGLLSWKTSPLTPISQPGCLPVF